jgi:hypothetical protein
MQSILQSQTYSNYEDVLGLQLPMIYQIFCWLNENRISVKSNKVIIEKAKYINEAEIHKFAVENFSMEISVASYNKALEYCS